ncbi:uncharacterized protein KY384_006108 [Bacidia gigantensis]|uniref:uncharacterized protein n=1 Tax=Bacidia gigantensis TaxID=2732470 RepID=UPI001D03E1C8|nr:uncharacterized protein KY384_006108 [Bacidia gigantensis]KAG8529471.1 hypothetical protein KY384_006108 [Bacidia gigantensis]
MASHSQSYHQQQQPPPSFLHHFADQQHHNLQRGPIPAGFYPDHDPNSHHHQPSSAKTGAKALQNNGESNKNTIRLRKACDNCSIRKVKCDESGPPCKACISLEIPCTFERPAKRRGPPNRLAASIKKQRQDSDPPSSPNHAAHAAQTLASFAQQPIAVLSAEAICPWTVLQPLIDDYFTFIHPLIPVPHEPSFRQALHDRQDVKSSTFLALMASMIGCLTASFPRRPRQHFRYHSLEHLFPNSMSLIERCRNVAIEAHGPATYNRSYTVHDAIISYLQGITYVYTFQRQPALLYFKECLGISTSLGLHKVSYVRDHANAASQAVGVANGGSNVIDTDLIVQELEKRVFWILFVTIKTLHQMGVSPFELSVPPATKCDPYPPLPTEIDDAYLTTTHIIQPSDDHMSELVGFNINTRIFSSFESVARMELNYGVDEMIDWKRQSEDLKQSLDNVKRLVDSLPSIFALNRGDSQSNKVSENDVTVTHGSMSTNTLEDRLKMQHEIQKANIHATQLGTRSYLVEKYFNLSDAYQRTTSHQPSPTSPNGVAPSEQDLNAARDADNAMSNEHSEIIASLLQMLSNIRQIYMEPNGASLISKVRSIATTLIDCPRTSKINLPLETGEYLSTFVAILGRLEKTVGATEQSNEEDEELKLREWADLREQQDKFLRYGGFFAGS